MKLRTHAALLWAMLCLSFMLRGQTPFRQQCRGEGSNNLANFTITNSLPTGLEDCEVTNCNPYFLAALKVEGSCVEHQWAFEDVPDPARQGFEFCKSFDLQRIHKVNHTVRISDDVPARVYTATCTFTPVQCCDLNFSVTLLKTDVVSETENKKNLPCPSRGAF